jgi:hypothetical protein
MKLKLSAFADLSNVISRTEMIIGKLIMTVRLNFGRHWFPFDKMGLKQFS